MASPFDLPNPNTKIWHYLDFKYFKNIVIEKKLRLTKVEKFCDQREGRHNTPSDRRFVNGINAMLNGKGFVLKGQAEEYNRSSTFASCWHINDYENVLFWERKNIDSVAIQSTIGKLQHFHNQFHQDFKLNLYKVAYWREGYIDPPEYRDKMGINHHFFIKDIAFKDENEVRLLAYNFKNIINMEKSKCDELYLDINHLDLIDSVYIHPLCIDINSERILDFCNTNKINVIKSKIYLPI